MTWIGQGQFSLFWWFSETWLYEAGATDSISDHFMEYWRSFFCSGWLCANCLFLKNVLFVLRCSQASNVGGVCCVKNLRPQSLNLSLSEQMSCRKQAASLWDKHRSDVRGPAQAEPWGRCLRDVGIWVTWRENHRRGQVRVFRIFWNNFIWLHLETGLVFRGLVGASCSLLGRCVRGDDFFGYWQYT